MRAFGQSPTNYAIERTIDEVANQLGLDRLELRRRNMIRHEEFPYLIPSGSTYDSGNYEAVIAKVLAKAPYDDLIAERDKLRGEGKLAGIGIAACLEPSGGNSAFEPLLNPKNETTTWMDSCRISIDLDRRHHRDDAHHVGGAGPRDDGRHGGRRGAGDRSGARARHPRRLAQLVAEQLAGRQPHGDHAGRRDVPRRATSSRTS